MAVPRGGCSSSAWLAVWATPLVLCSLATPVKFTISHEHFKGKLRRFWTMHG